MTLRASHPLPHVFCKSRKIVKALQVIIDDVPFDAQVLVHQDIAESAQGREALRKLNRQHTNLPQPQQAFVIIGGAQSIFQRDDTIGDVDAALRGNLQVALDDVAQIGIRLKLNERARPQRL